MRALEPLSPEEVVRVADAIEANVARVLPEARLHGVEPREVAADLASVCEIGYTLAHAGRVLADPATSPRNLLAALVAILREIDTHLPRHAPALGAYGAALADSLRDYEGN